MRTIFALSAFNEPRAEQRKKLAEMLLDYEKEGLVWRAPMLRHAAFPPVAHLPLDAEKAAELDSLYSSILPVLRLIHSETLPAAAEIEAAKGAGKRVLEILDNFQQRAGGHRSYG